MNTLLFFVSSMRRSCLGRLDGILRHLTKHGCTAEVMFKAETGKTILRAINDRIYELAKAEFAKGWSPLRAGILAGVFPRFIDNAAFPSDWFDRTSACPGDCADCGYCGRVFGGVLKWLSQEHEGCFVS